MRTLSATRAAYARHLAVYSAFAYEDVKKAGVSLYAVSMLDDSTPEIRTGEPERVLRTYSDIVLPWSEREGLLAYVA